MRDSSANEHSWKALRCGMRYSWSRRVMERRWDEDGLPLQAACLETQKDKDTWISDRSDAHIRVELSEMEDSGTEIRMKGFWSGSLNPDTSLDLLPCGLPVIRLPLTLPPGKHHSHPRPSHHLPTRLSPPSLILRSFSTPSHPHKLLHLFT
ncbi:hypothetical protein Q8A67_023283 [Cirrhinus molitorella]|uniref:Uncharacterized protein n=1 Tax=Cirrhinus molitorella TaxID=172907 RepID=A0AA88TB33_9TELE|nr:hypothetical protein Q8A67_023283 [Cirrhinus molitorella]